MTRLLILGGGGHGAVVAETATEAGIWSEILFLDDDASRATVLEFRVAGTLADVNDYLDDNTEVFVAIGKNRQRLKLLERMSGENGSLATIIHPTACISPSASIAAGTVVCAGAIVNARATIGLGSILNTAATIDHDCVIGCGAHISPGANLAGGVTVGDCAWIGIGASVREGSTIGRDAVIGAGAAVVSDVEDGVTACGVPARTVGQ